MSSVELANSFRVACNRAATALSTVLEVLDYAPVVGKDGLNALRSRKRPVSAHYASGPERGNFG